MNVRRYLAPTGRVLREAQDTKGFVLFLFLIFCLLRVVLVWGYHNLFHMTYLPIAFFFFQNEFLSMFIMRNIKKPLTPEELVAAKKSAILSGYIWSLMIYAAGGVTWVIPLANPSRD